MKYSKTKTEKSKAGELTKSEYDSCKYWAPKTVGFYQLRNTMCHVTDPFNTYMFVSDANAPTPVYDVVPDPEQDMNTWWNT